MKTSAVSWRNKAYRGGNICSGCAQNSAHRRRGCQHQQLKRSRSMAYGAKLALKWQRNGASLSLSPRVTGSCGSLSWRRQHGALWQRLAYVAAGAVGAIGAASAAAAGAMRLAYRSGGSNAKWRICVAASTHNGAA
jgi:hypothetical protein